MSSRIALTSILCTRYAMAQKIDEVSDAAGRGRRGGEEESRSFNLKRAMTSSRYRAEHHRGLVRPHQLTEYKVSPPRVQVVLSVKNANELLKFADKLQDAGILHRVWVPPFLFSFRGHV